MLPGFPLLVGLCPAPDAAPGTHPLDGLTGFRLLSFAGLTVPHWLRPTQVTPGDVLDAYAECVNLWPEYTASRTAEEGRQRAASLDCRGRVVVLLGREVQRAFRDRLSVPGASFYSWVEPAEGDEAEIYVTVPHPSPINRTFNRKAHRVTTGRVVRRALEIAA